MCNNFPNIRITEGNNFSLILPLRSRTYVATKPIDEDIDPEQLENVVVTFGGVEYPAQRTAQGVQIDLPSTLAVGTYNILLTAEYLESSIRAAYESAVTIVPWSAQSTAEQYIAGSPIVLRAAYVLSCVLTDAELEALKQEWREKIAEAEQAKEEAEQAKAEWEQKAAELDGVAQESTSQTILTAVENIDFSTLAKEATLGTPQDGQPSTIFAAIAQSGRDSKQTIADAINQMGGSATADMTWAQLSQQIEHLDVIAQGNIFSASAAHPISIGQLIVSNMILEIYDEAITGGIPASTFRYFFGSLRKATFKNAISIGDYAFYGKTNLTEINIPKVSSVGVNAFQNSGVQILNIPSCPGFPGSSVASCRDLIDIIWGSAFNGNLNLTIYYNPSNAYNANSSSLCFADDEQRYGRIFANNFEKWKWCIINHWAANLPDRTGMNAYTITMPSALAYFDAEMIAAFTNKNWTLA